VSLPIPGTETTLVDSPRPRSNPTDTGVGFIVAEAERGPVAPRFCRSLGEVAAIFGARQAYSYLYDAAETAFREGLAGLWISRVVSDAAVTAFADLSDGVAATLRVLAVGPGAYGNDLRVIVRTSVDDAAIPVGSVQLRITDDGVVVEDSPVFADKDSLINWAAANARHFTLQTQASPGMPVRVASPGTALATGADDRAGITDAEWTEALDRFGKGLGPGQVAMPGRTTTAAHTVLLEHARTRNRHALLDLPDTDLQATLIAAAQAANAGAANAGGRHGSAYWPWAIVPGLTPYSSRVVPYSAVQMGLAARSDAQGNPNQPVAGPIGGQSRWAQGLTQDSAALTDAERGALNDAGVNVALMFTGQSGPQTYGNRTLRTEAQDPLWLQASGSRLAMLIAARGDAILGGYVHRQVDGDGVTQGKLQGELGGMLGELYEPVGALYGANPQDAFSVDTGPAVNPPEQLQAGLLKAAISFRASPGADRVELELSRVAITEAIA
jgi:hypothetical protein